MSLRHYYVAFVLPYSYIRIVCVSLRSVLRYVIYDLLGIVLVYFMYTHIFFVLSFPFICMLVPLSILHGGRHSTRPK